MPIPTYAEFVKNFSDQVSLTDSISREAILNRNLQDSVSLSDSVQIIPIYKRIFTETINLIDNFLREIKTERNFSETLNLSDSIITEGIFDRIFTDSFNLSDVSNVTKLTETYIIFKDGMLRIYVSGGEVARFKADGTLELKGTTSENAF